jgi:predicted MFS family arabinose efflux permease
MTAASDTRVHERASGGEAYAVWLLFAVYACSYIDRQILNILAEPIKGELHLTDWQVGLLSGLAFSLFYAVLGLPLGALADRPTTNRPKLIAICLSLWSGMTMLCGLPGNFVQLALARLGVGVGEAGCSPAAHALIADLVPERRRASAMGLYALAIPVGKLVGLGLGGGMAQAFGWRAAFAVVGAPGLVLAALVWRTLKEPRGSGRVARVRSAAMNWRSLGELAQRPTLWLMSLGNAFMSFLSLGEAAFLGSFLIRVHHLKVGEAGLLLGLALGLGGGAGSWLGGRLCDLAGKGDVRRHILWPALAGVIGGAVLVGAVTASSVVAMLTLLALSAALTSAWYGPSFSVIQGAAPREARATASAVNLLISNLIGLGLGPLGVGLLSDAFNKGFAIGGLSVASAGPAEGLRLALMAASSAVLAAFACYAFAARTISRSS